jgi:acyl carrier protein
MDKDFRVIIATALGIATNQVCDDLAPETMKSWHSLAMVEIITGLEKRYNIQFELDELVGFTSVGAIRMLLRSKGIAT